MEEPTIALIAHDAKKADMVHLVQAHRDELLPLATNLATAEAVVDVIFHRHGSRAETAVSPADTSLAGALT